jgi:hypothetical protein
MFPENSVFFRGLSLWVGIESLYMKCSGESNHKSQKYVLIDSLMKLVWTLSVLFSGPIALAVYWWAGRTQIDHESVWRGGWRSISHCYSGCGIGEVVGVSLASAVFGFGVFGVVVLTFALAYFFGYIFNIGPLMQDGVPFKEALTDTAYSETLSITGMEIAAIGADLILAPSASLLDSTVPLTDDRVFPRVPSQYRLGLTRYQRRHGKPSRNGQLSSIR